MYRLLTESKADIQHYTLAGTIDNIAYDDDNVIKGSLAFSNQCASNSEFRLGGCYIGELNLTFVDVNIPRNEWVGKDVTFTVHIGDDDIPCGVFNIDSAKHTKNIVTIKAYDNMRKFDSPCGTEEGTSGTAYNLLSLACDQCHVQFGMTAEEVEALPNGNLPFVMTEKGDIETWRDFIYWIAVSLGSFATMDRSGRLVLRKFHASVDDTIDYDVRFNKSIYGDEIITYTGINCYVTETQKVEYYHAEQETGYTLNIGHNPFFQVPAVQREQYIQNMLAALAEIQFNTCSVVIPFGFHYDLGDVLQFPNGQGSATNLFCVMGFAFKYNGDCKLVGIPGQKQSKSKTDKNMQGMLNTIGRNEFTSYELRNSAAIQIDNGDLARLLQARIASNTATKAQIHIEVNLETQADEGEDITQGIVVYLINSEDAEFYPTETWIDGYHVLHLMYILPLAVNDMQIFEVYMGATNGTIYIERGGVWLYASGAGLVGDGKWDGLISVHDAAEDFTISDMLFANASDAITTALQTPTQASHTDVASAWSLSDITFTSAEDAIVIVLHSDAEAIITENGDDLMTEEAERLYTEGD